MTHTNFTSMDEFHDWLDEYIDEMRYRSTAIPQMHPDRPHLDQVYRQALKVWDELDVMRCMIMELP